MRQRNGIPIDFPHLRKPTQKVKTQKPVEYSRYNMYVTMYKRVDGHDVWTMVPFMHPDYGKLIQEGFRVTEKWDKREVSA